MADIQHNNIQVGDIHQITNWVWPTATDRTNETVAASDVLKLGYQEDTNSFYILLSHLPVTWQKFLNETDPVPPTGPAGGHLSGTYPNPDVIDDSHAHTPGVTIPAYPTTLPPSGAAASVDITGTYPNPVLTTTGVAAGTYNRATVEVDSKGRVISISANADPVGPGTPFPGFNDVPLTGNSTSDNPRYNDNSNRIATTQYVMQGNIVYPVLPEGESLTINTGYQKEVYGSYTIEDDVNTPTTTLTVIGTLTILGTTAFEGVYPNFTPPENVGVGVPPVVPLEIGFNNFKIVASGFLVQSPIIINGTLLVT